LGIIGIGGCFLKYSLGGVFVARKISAALDIL